MEKKKNKAVIIGSGLGGLQCGYILSKKGYEVTVLEKNRQIGGNLQTFVRDKVIFDTGIHYIGGLSEGQNLHQFFKYFGLMDKLKLRQLDVDGFDIVSFDGDPQEYKYAQGFDNFAETLISYFPNERLAIEAYCAKMREVCDAFPLYNLEKSVSGSAMIESAEYLGISAKQYIESLTPNKKLQQVLAGSCPLYAGVAESTPLYVHALVVNSYVESSWRCVDGGSQIARILHHAIRENGGEVIKYADAQSFVFDGNEISAVQLANGERVEGDLFVSNVHPAVTMEMVGEGGNLRKAYRKRISSLKNTVSVFSLHIVFKENEFPYHNHNYYHFKEEDVWGALEYTDAEWPKHYVLSFGASSKHPDYTDGLTVMVYMNYEDMAPWMDSFNVVSDENDRGESYEEFKTDRAERIIDELEKKFPDIRSKIKSYYTSTPLSYRDYIGSADGSLYGIMKDYRDPMKSFISPKTKIPNLLLTGQNLNMHGVLGVTVSSISTCAELFGMNNLLDEVRKA